MIKIEFDKSTKENCNCCGKLSTKLTRFVYQDNDAFAVYKAIFTESHKEKIVYVLIGLGEWGERSESKDRSAFSVKIWNNQNSWSVTVTDKAESPWSNVEILGRILDREEAINHPLIKDVYHITDHIMTEDKTIIEYFERSGV